MKKLAIFWLACLACSNAMPCYLPTADLRIEPSRLVRETPVIVMAKAISMSAGGESDYATRPGSYHFLVTEVLKGALLTELRLAGELEQSTLWDTSFSHHNEPSFWAENQGRLGSVGDCKTSSPAGFVVGRVYLLFLNGPDDSKRYERVDSDDDKWLEYVREQSRASK